MNTHQIAVNIFSGFLAGLACALGGALKDSPHEGFKSLIFTRSIFVGTFWGAVSCFVTTDFFLSFAFSGYFERMTVEGWKIIRQRIPGKFEWKARGETEWKWL
ncbi:MAG TPA: hypothetical protein VFV58_12630 [Blastocatellia bacterium]|jgi:hypothetical protein|nr:hypothetical protein [Blastocatellia bacterium]